MTSWSVHAVGASSPYLQICALTRTEGTLLVDWTSHSDRVLVSGRFVCDIGGEGKDIGPDHLCIDALEAVDCAGVRSSLRSVLAHEMEMLPANRGLDNARVLWGLWDTYQRNLIPTPPPTLLPLSPLPAQPIVKKADKTPKTPNHGTSSTWLRAPPIVEGLDIDGIQATAPKACDANTIIVNANGRVRNAPLQEANGTFALDKSSCEFALIARWALTLDPRFLLTAAKKFIHRDGLFLQKSGTGAVDDPEIQGPPLPFFAGDVARRVRNAVLSGGTASNDGRADVMLARIAGGADGICSNMSTIDGQLVRLYRLSFVLSQSVKSTLSVMPTFVRPPRPDWHETLSAREVALLDRHLRYEVSPSALAILTERALCVSDHSPCDALVRNGDVVCVRDTHVCKNSDGLHTVSRCCVPRTDRDCEHPTKQRCVTRDVKIVADVDKLTTYEDGSIDASIRLHTQDEATFVNRPRFADAHLDKSRFSAALNRDDACCDMHIFCCAQFLLCVMAHATVPRFHSIHFCCDQRRLGKYRIKRNQRFRAPSSQTVDASAYLQCALAGRRALCICEKIGEVWAVLRCGYDATTWTLARGRDLHLLTHINRAWLSQTKYVTICRVLADADEYKGGEFTIPAKDATRVLPMYVLHVA